MKRLAPAAAILLTASLSGCGSGELELPSSPNATASITMSEVAQHADDQSCWTAVDGKVYDVTPWISQHPGGAERIRGLCGKDGTAAFSGQHAGEDDPQERLASFQIGTLAG